MMRLGTVSVRGGSRAGTAAARPVTAVRAAGYTSTTRDVPSREENKEDTYVNIFNCYMNFTVYIIIVNFCFKYLGILQYRRQG